MVWYCDNIKCYHLSVYLSVLTTLPEKELVALKTTWGPVSSARLGPMLELKFSYPPNEFIGYPHKHIRLNGYKAGRGVRFVIVNKHVQYGTVWHMDRFVI